MLLRGWRIKPQRQMKFSSWVSLVSSSVLRFPIIWRGGVPSTWLVLNKKESILFGGQHVWFWLRLCCCLWRPGYAFWPVVVLGVCWVVVLSVWCNWLVWLLGLFPGGHTIFLCLMSHRKSCRKFESSHKVVYNKSISKKGKKTSELQHQNTNREDS